MPEGVRQRDRRVLVVDMDVHQGDGSAEILRGAPNAFTWSVHCSDNYPFGFDRRHAPYLGNDRSSLDSGLPKGSGDVEAPAEAPATTKEQYLERMGVMTALAIGIHNFPEGLATFVDTVARSIF